MRPFCLSPSLLAANFGCLEQEVTFFNQSQAGWLHLDVMDGHFVPNISFGAPVITAIRALTRKVLDVHLMISHPDTYLRAFRDAGADRLTVHYEACPHLVRTLQAIRDLGAKPGVALNPHTPVSLLVDVLPYTELVLLMSVNPGFGGQSFLPQTIGRVAALRKIADNLHPDLIIQVDGGVDLINTPDLLEAGADNLVAGTSVFQATHRESAVNQFYALATAFNLRNA